MGQIVSSSIYALFRSAALTTMVSKDRREAR